jgi:hypothetical protein
MTRSRCFCIHAAMQRLRAVAVRAQRLGQLVDLETRAAEDDRRLRTVEIEDAAERVDLLALADDVGDLADAGQLAGARFSCGDLHLLRTLQVPSRDRHDARRKRGREQRRLRVVRGLATIASMSSEKPMSSISSGFVEDEHAHGGEIERAAAR